MNSFEIKTNPDLSWIENRNGFRPIQGLLAQISEGGVVLTGIGVSDRVLRGLISLTTAEMDNLATEWLKRSSEVEGPAVAVVLPEEAWNTLLETLQMDACSSAISLEIRESISEALDKISEFNSDVGDSDA